MLLTECKDSLTNSIMENCQDIITVKDLNYNYTVCNRAFIKLLNLPHESEVLGKNIKDILPAETITIIEKYYDDLIKNRDTINYTFIFQTNYEDKVISQLAIPFVEDGEITGILSISKDITTEENLKQKLLEMVCKLNDTLDLKKRLEDQKELFMATLTHDLKNPVQAQLMSLKMLKNGTLGALTSEQDDILDILLESSEYMQEMLFTILQTYKFDNGVIKLKKQKISINKLMRDCLNEIYAFAVSKSIKILYKCDSGEIFADLSQLRRVISNLMNNAIKYSYRNSELKINISIKDGIAIFMFENESDPIPKDIKEHMFDKYVTGKQKTGIGLGLYFSKKVIEAHGGTIYLSTDGNFNKFVFKLPINNSLVNNIKW